jgi:pimeloyl-ACP methyl ester carboxylesterase
MLNRDRQWEHRLHGAATPDTPRWRPSLLIREQRPANGERRRPALYVHGATFPSASSVMFRFDGTSWADRLNDVGFDVFGLDFAGYGGSERYPAMNAAAPDGEPLGRAPEAADQIERAVGFILEDTGASRLSIVAHSWGAMAAGLFAARHPELVESMVFFGPIVRREGPCPSAELGAWRWLTAAEQRARFVEDVPRGHAGVLLDHEFPRWTEVWLDSDDASRRRTPAAVRTPNGPLADIMAAWSGRLPYDPGLIRARLAILRGAWDSLCTDADAAWFRAALTAAPEIRDVKIPEATHLMHLERNRDALFQTANAFLTGAWS